MPSAFRLPTDIRFLSLCCALLLYGVAGSPTPDAPGWIEALIGAFLLLSLSISTAWSARLSFAPLLMVGCGVPLAMGFFHGHDLEGILRDLIPFMFLCLPFFIDPRTHETAFVRLCLIVGVLFALRVVGQGLGILPPAVELLYLANSPLVVFAAIVGLGAAAMDVYHRTVSLKSVLFFAGGLVCLLAMLIDVQRATITAVMVSLVILAVIGMVRAPARMIWPLVIALAIFVSSWELIGAAWHSMATKTALVGVNMRWQELQAVYGALQESGWYGLFGIGWGGRFDSPAVGGWSVPYTHSLLTYMLLKTGFLGLAATVLALSVCLRNIMTYPSLLSLALFWAILIPTFFYASYKSLDFGLVLVLAVLLPRAIASRTSL